MKTNDKSKRDIPIDTYNAIHLDDSVDYFFPNSEEFDINTYSPDAIYHLTYFKQCDDYITTSGDVLGVLDPNTKTYELLPEPIHITFFASDTAALGLDKDSAMLSQSSLQEAEDNLSLRFGYSKNFNHLDGDSLAASLEDLSEPSVQQL